MKKNLFLLVSSLLLIVSCSKTESSINGVSKTKNEFIEETPEFRLPNGANSSSSCYRTYLDSLNKLTKAVSYYGTQSWSSFSSKLTTLNNSFETCLGGVLPAVNPLDEEKPVALYTENGQVGTNSIILIPNDSTKIRSYLSQVNNCWNTYAPNMLSRLTTSINAVWSENNNYLNNYYYTWYKPDELLLLFKNKISQSGNISYLYSVDGSTNHHIWINGFLASVALKIAIPYNIAKDYFVRPENPPIYYDIVDEPADGEPYPETYYEIWNGIFVFIDNTSNP